MTKTVLIQYDILKTDYFNLKKQGTIKKTLQQELFQYSFRFLLRCSVSSLCVVCSANQKVREGIFGQIPLQIFHKL